MAYSKEHRENWRVIKITRIQDENGLFADFLYENGCLGIHVEQDKLTAFFDIASDSALPLIIIKYLKDNNNKGCQVSDNSIKDENWHLTWKKYFAPQKISDKITVYPEWEEIDAQVKIPIKIRPGMAFGTGTHETTQMALILLEKEIEQGMKILDAGCGAGILTIAAMKMGAKSVDSVEIDSEAEPNFNENLELNSCVGKMLVKDVCKLENYNYELIVSNIQINPNKALLKTLNHANFRNPIIFTGILNEEREKFIKIIMDSKRIVTAELAKK